jgi:monoamine oxidase
VDGAIESGRTTAAEVDAALSAQRETLKS